MIIYRHIGPSAATAGVEAEIAQAIEATEDAADRLRQIRKMKIFKR